MEHKHIQSAEINFSKLESRIMAINDPYLGKHDDINWLLNYINGPTMIMATGGSKTVANYLQLFLERGPGWFGNICEVIEPRDYFRKQNRGLFKNLIVISASGNTNGVEKALETFEGAKYLICENPKEAKYDVICWGNELYEKEKSFISLATTLGPMALLLNNSLPFTNVGLSPDDVTEINNKIKELMHRSAKKIESLDVNFKNTSLVQIISGYNNKTSSSVLESNLIEAGLAASIIHDKGSFCHGRSNLLYRYPYSQVIYLTHDFYELDNLLIDSIANEYANLNLFSTADLNEDGITKVGEDIFLKEYYLALQMYYLSKKIAEDKEIDLTMPDYNPRLVKKLYNFRGEM